MRILLLICLLIPATASAQTIDVKIEVVESAGSLVRMAGHVSQNGVRNLSFIRSSGGFEGLGERVSALVLKDKAGKIINYQSLRPSEFVADSDISEFSYNIDLTPRKETNAAAHISWLTNDSGVLMLGDMLPRIFSIDSRSIGLKLSVPQDWDSSTSASSTLELDFDDSVYYLGKGAQCRSRKVGTATINLFSNGEWQFSEKELDNAVIEILREHERMFATGSKSFTLGMLKFPNATQPGQWQAETRGRNITIISSDMPFKTQSIQRLHEQLRHEMFHLWIPNGVNLSGNYDWFYEGFALYQSLKTAVALNRIRFDDFLDTLSRAQAIDARQTNRLSLIDASNKRWSGADTYVYARGMVAAFLFDLQMLNASKGKRSVETLIRELYSKHRIPAERSQGNTAILALIARYPELSGLVERYVKGDGRFEWKSELALAGLESKPELAVIAKPSGRQKDLLDRLGYNNWKRATPKK